tara:strand:+ start:978 stop:1136 length:159 start_codon:yes stop_codon:yes gene_type:complete
MPKKEKIILVLSEAKNYLFGAFDNTEEGKEAAEKYAKKVGKKQKIKLYLKIK